MKTKIICKDLSFQYRLRRLISLKKNNPGIALNVLFCNKKSPKKDIYTVRSSELNVKCKKQVNLSIILDGEERHYTAIKNISRLLSKLNGKFQQVYH